MSKVKDLIFGALGKCAHDWGKWYDVPIYYGVWGPKQIVAYEQHRVCKKCGLKQIGKRWEVD